MFYFGPVTETQKTTSLSQDDPLSINLSPYVKGMRQLFRTNADYTRQGYITQIMNRLTFCGLGNLCQNLAKFSQKAQNTLF